MQKHHAALITLLFSLQTLCTSAQSDFTITKTTERLTPFTQKYLQYTETKEGTINFNAILTRNVQKTTYRGRNVLLITQTYQTGKSINKDSSFCDLQTLTPIAYFTYIKAEHYKEQVFFLTDSISNTILFADSLQQFSRKASGVYNGVMTDELISALPLTAGKQFLLKTVNPGRHYFEYVTRILVDSKEEVVLPDDKKIMCWKLRVYQGEGNGFSTQWYSVDKHRQIKTRSESANGNAFIRIAICA